MPHGPKEMDGSQQDLVKEDSPDLPESATNKSASEVHPHRIAPGAILADLRSPPPIPTAGIPRPIEEKGVFPAILAQVITVGKDGNRAKTCASVIT